jgi:hypothetical protein
MDADLIGFICVYQTEPMRHILVRKKLEKICATSLFFTRKKLLKIH